MAKSVYNPRYFTSENKRVVNEAHIKSFVWSHARWDLKVNEVKKFPDEVGEALLRTFEFLMEVTPKNIAEVRKMQEDKSFKCDSCSFETDTKIALAGHKKSHGVSEETSKLLGEIDEARPEGTYKGYAKEAKPSIEAQEGIPSTVAGNVTDRDGVEWYGEGLEEETLVPKKPAGHFQ